MRIIFISFYISLSFSRTNLTEPVIVFHPLPLSYLIFPRGNIFSCAFVWWFFSTSPKKISSSLSIQQQHSPLISRYRYVVIMLQISKAQKMMKIHRHVIPVHTDETCCFSCIHLLMCRGFSAPLLGASEIFIISGDAVATVQCGAVRVGVGDGFSPVIKRIHIESFCRLIVVRSSRNGMRCIGASSRELQSSLMCARCVE